MMIEQPLGSDDFLDHAHLQARLRTPICLDESIRSEGDLELALELGGCAIVNIKPGRVGGHGVSRRLHDVMRERGHPVWCGGMLETGVGRAHNLALASLPGFTLPGDISSSRRYWERDIVHPEFEVGPDGQMAVPTGIGIGVRGRRGARRGPYGPGVDLRSMKRRSGGAPNGVPGSGRRSLQSPGPVGRMHHGQ